MHNVFMIILSGLIIMTLTSCTTVSPPSAFRTLPPSLDSEQSMIANLMSWQINGKIAVLTPQNSGSATIQWQQDREKYHINLMGPFGSHQLSISGKPGYITLLTSDGKQLKAQSPEMLLKQQWGFQLPVSYLTSWIRGIPVAHLVSQQKVDKEGRIKQLLQAGWQIDYIDYAKNNNLKLPHRINLFSHALKVKIVIYDWHVRISKKYLTKK